MKEEYLREEVLREEVNRELLADCEEKFSCWIYRFVRAYQVLLEDAEYRFLYDCARNVLIKVHFGQWEEYDKEKSGQYLDLITDLMQKDDLLSPDRYGPLVNFLAQLLKGYRDKIFHKC